MATTRVNTSFYRLSGQKLPNTSMLNMFNPLNDDDGKYTLNIFKVFDINDKVKNDNNYFDLYEVESDDWWDSIASIYYKNPLLWWTIPAVNDVYNPFEELEEGGVIKTLKNDFIYRFIKESKNIANL